MMYNVQKRFFSDSTEDDAMSASSSKQLEQNLCPKFWWSPNINDLGNLFARRFSLNQYIMLMNIARFIAVTGICKKEDLDDPEWVADDMIHVFKF